nr:amidohydrolase [Acidobacteriota bacterium]
MSTVTRQISMFAVAAVCASAGVYAQQVPAQPRAAAPAAAQNNDGLTPAPARRSGEGLGPFKTMVIRGAMLIDGTGGPPTGPVDIVIEGNRIASVRSAGTPGLPMRENRPPQNADHEIDARGMYVMPGFVDLHVHAGGAPKNADAEYAYKLWLAHGVTTVRGVPLGSNSFSVSEKQRSERNEIVAPRIFNCQRPGNVPTPAAARAWVQNAAKTGVDCLKLGAYEPAIMEALNDEAHKHGMGTTAHLQQGGVAQMNAIDAARAGLD